MRQERKSLRLAIHTHIRDPLAPIPVHVLDSDTRPSRNPALDITKNHSPRVRTTNIARRLTTRARRARKHARVIIQARGLAFILVLGRSRARCARTRVQHPVHSVLERRGGPGDGERQPHIRAPHQVIADPSVAHVHEVVAYRQHKRGLACVGVGAAVGELFPCGPRPGQRGRGGVIVVVGVPARQLRGEHEVDTVFLDDGWGLIFLGKGVGVGLNG